MPTDYFIRIKGKIHGPVDSKKLRAVVSAGKLQPTDEIAKSSDGPWRQAASVSGLFEASHGSMNPSTEPDPSDVIQVPRTVSQGSVVLPPGSYVASVLANGEQVVYIGKLHWGIYIAPMAMIASAFILPFFVSSTIAIVWGFVVFIFGPAGLISAALASWTNEFAVTNRKVIAKTGLIWRKTIELMLAKIDSVQVSQSISGRLLGYGDLVLAVATEKQPMRFLQNPMQFKQAVENAQAVIKS